MLSDFVKDRYTASDHKMGLRHSRQVIAELLRDALRLVVTDARRRTHSMCNHAAQSGRVGPATPRDVASVATTVLDASWQESLDKLDVLERTQ